MKLILDTNITVDWLVFSDPSTIALQLAIDERRVQIAVNALVVDELQRVLAYPKLHLSPLVQTEILTRFKARTVVATMPEGFSRADLMLPSRFPLCRDHDDDHFLALAYHSRADALLTKDRALLKLRRKVVRFGVRIRTLNELFALQGTAS